MKRLVLVCVALVAFALTAYAADAPALDSPATTAGLTADRIRTAWQSVIVAPNGMLQIVDIAQRQKGTMDTLFTTNFPDIPANVAALVAADPAAYGHFTSDFATLKQAAADQSASYGNLLSIIFIMQDKGLTACLGALQTLYTGASAQVISNPQTVTVRSRGFKK